jgi:hypothetical protein
MSYNFKRIIKEFGNLINKQDMIFVPILIPIPKPNTQFLDVHVCI